MRGRGWLAVFVAALFAAGVTRTAGDADAASRRSGDRTPNATSAATELFGRLPAGYETNAGQFDERVRFVARGGGAAAWLLDGEAVIQIGSDDPGSEDGPHRRPARRSGGLLRMRYGGARPAGVAELPGKTNYYLGGDRSRWRSGIKSYERAVCSEIAPGVSLVWRGTKRALAYDLVVAPGADLAAASIEFGGAKRIAVDDATGDLVVTTDRDAEVRQTRPRCFQDIHGARREIDGRFVVDGTSVRFAAGEYDRTRELVVDPTFEFGAYVGGTGTDFANAIAVGPGNDIYLGGESDSTVFPWSNAFQAQNRGGVDAFVMRISAAGFVSYATFLGSSGGDAVRGIVAGPTGDAYVCGFANASNFPLQNALQATYGGGSNDAVFARLSAGGGTLVASTYLGGSGSDGAAGIALDSFGAVYLAGTTESPNFPLANARQSSFGGVLDAWVAKLNPSASALVYSTYHGGVGIDIGEDCAIDTSGALVVVGCSESANLPVSNALQPSLSGFTDAFIAKYNASGTALVFGTYLGGTNFDDARGVAVDATGVICVAGDTQSTNFPLVTPYQPFHGGAMTDGWVSKLSATGSTLAYSTYLGGSGYDSASSVMADGAGGFVVAGTTGSNAFPVINALQSPRLGGYEMFVARFTATSTTPAYATYWTGTGDEEAYDCAVDAKGSVYFCGVTTSTTLPVKGGILSGFAGGAGDIYVARLDASVPAAPADLMATYQGGPLARLTWSDNSTNEIGFEVERRAGGGPFTIYSGTAAGTTVLDDFSLQAATLYTYRVRAVGNEGKSAFSNESSFTSAPTLGPPPAPKSPQSLEAVVVSATEVDLVWADKSNDEIRFDIQRADGGATFASIGNSATDTTSFADLAAPSGWTVSYRVRALASQGPSEPSSSVTVTTPGNLTLATAAGVVFDTVSPKKDKASWSGAFAPLAGAALGDVKASGLRLQFGPPISPVVVTIRPADGGWKGKSTKLTWKSPKGAVPKVSIVLDTKKRTLTASASSFDFTFPATKEFRVLAAFGGLSGGSTETWLNGKKTGSFEPPQQ